MWWIAPLVAALLFVTLVVYLTVGLGKRDSIGVMGICIFWVQVTAILLSMGSLGGGTSRQQGTQSSSLGFLSELALQLSNLQPLALECSSSSGWSFEHSFWLTMASPFIFAVVAFVF